MARFKLWAVWRFPVLASVLETGNRLAVNCDPTVHCETDFLGGRPSAPFESVNVVPYSIETFEHV